MKKVLAVVRYILGYVTAIVGKALGFVITPIVYKNKDWIRNYAWNWMLSRGIKINRSTVYSEDAERYYTAKGYIVKRATSWYGIVVVGLSFFLDDDANLDCCSTMFSDPEKINGLKVRGSYFDLGDLQAENKIKFDWYTFKEFYYWMVIRNGFYNYNYVVEDSWLNACGKLDKGPSKRIHKSGGNTEEWSEHGFYEDENGKTFFLCTYCKLVKGKAYGYEIGWRRKSDGGVNQVIRLYWAK